MAWRESCAMDERVKFISEWLRRGEPLVALCRRYGISRKTAYKWIARYRGEGAQGLVDRSCAPRDHGRQTEAAVAEAIVRLRRRHRHWGPRKLRAKLKEQEPARQWPAASTIGAILRRAGLTRPRRVRRRVPPACTALTQPVRPNHVWRADHKGYFMTGDGQRCEPLTVTDGFSRYLVVLTATRGTAEAPARRAFLAAFRRYGLPDVIRTDNGTPFAAATVTGLTQLVVWWIRLGIRHERIAPGRPDQNGGHERFHGTLAQATCSPPAPSATAQKQRLARFARQYNQERPHEALGQVAPTTLYRPSPRRLPRRLPAPCYPPHATRRKVRSNGEIKWQGQLVYIAEILAGEQLGIVAERHNTHAVWFYEVELGVIDGKTGKLHRRSAPPRRRTAPVR